MRTSSARRRTMWLASSGSAWRSSSANDWLAAIRPVKLGSKTAPRAHANDPLARQVQSQRGAAACATRCVQLGKWSGLRSRATSIQNASCVPQTEHGRHDCSAAKQFGRSSLAPRVPLRRHASTASQRRRTALHDTSTTPATWCGWPHGSALPLALFCPTLAVAHGGVEAGVRRQDVIQRATTAAGAWLRRCGDGGAWVGRGQEEGMGGEGPREVLPHGGERLLGGRLVQRHQVAIVCLVLARLETTRAPGRSGGGTGGRGGCASRQPSPGQALQVPGRRLP